ncbi:MAG: acyl-CoA/acyl-ACP dehydrogenase [Bryobacterales bacterium]|nr:acyl-CoA/acyl-ACP dehydrogenase [Bryobacterales bacterium]
MQFDLSETQQLLAKTARQFLAAECPMPEVRRILETPTAHDASLHRKMAGQGWTGIAIPEDLGGMGLGMIELAATFEQLGRALVPGAFFSTVALAAPLLATAEQLAPLCDGSQTATAAFIEAEADWNPASWQCAARDNQLTGAKMFVPDAAEAAFLLAAARGNGTLGIYRIAKDAPGLEIIPLKSIDLTRRLYEVRFHNTPAEPIVTGPAAGHAIARALDIATLALTAEMAGGMARVLEITVEYAKARKQFDTPIGKFQAVQHMCADMYLWSESSKSAVYYAAYALDKNLPEAASALSVAKLYAADAYREIGNRAIQVHGGMGFTWENDVHLYYRRAKAGETMLGDNVFHRERLAKLVVDRL